MEAAEAKHRVMDAPVLQQAAVLCRVHGEHDRHENWSCRVRRLLRTH